MSGRPRGRAAATAVAAVMTAMAGAQSNDGGPVVVSPRTELKWIDFYDIEAALELEWRTNYDRNDPAGGPSSRTVEDRMREILELRTQGYVGHPNLLELDLGGRFWFDQQWLSQTNEPTEFIPQFLLDWDVSGLFLKETAVPFTLYTRQNTSEIDRAFGSSLENTFNEYGVRASFRAPSAPTNIQIFRRQIDQVDNGVGQDFKIDQFTVQADGRLDLDLNHRLAWDAKYDIVDESGQLRTPRSFNRFEGTATHTLGFGVDDNSSLRTQLRVVNTSGDLPYQLVRVLPRLRLWHSPSLQSWYDYRFEWSKQTSQEQMINEATANFQFQLFDSLTMIGNAGYNGLDVPTDGFSSNELFTRLDVQYLKQVPGGALEANVNGIISGLDQSARGAPIQITDDLRAFSPNAFFIDQRNIQASSIVITDITGTIVYALNVDYVVFAFPDSVQVQIVPGGNIVPNQVVLVDYTIGPDPGGRTTTTGVGVELRYTFQEGWFRGLSFYGNYFHQDQTLSIETPDFPANEFEDLRYGIEYNYWKLYFRAERQHRNSTLSPFDATRIEGRYTEPLGRNSNLVVSALYQEIDRTDEDFRQQTTTFSAQWNQQFTERLRTSLLFQYQLSDDNQSFDTDAFEGQLDVSWRYRQTEIYGQFRGSINDSAANDTTFARVIVGIRREF